MRATLLVALGLLGCARIEPPPGGPSDREPPVLLATRPDSLAVLPDFNDDVEFRFDEVVSEGSQASMGLGTSDLERLILLSPAPGVPRISWKRDRITVRPREGWERNRVYRVELLPGVMDLAQNRSLEGRVLTFTTGAPLPDGALSGRLIDWTTARPARAGLVTAVLMPDSLPYRTLTDSAGRYTLGPIPRGEYVVYGGLDQNRNQRVDGREAWDSVRVAAGDSLPPPLWAFVHDTVGPRIQSVAFRDTLTAEVTFNQMLDPAFRFDSGAVTVLRLSDSTALAVVSLLPPSEDDSVQAARRASADSARPRPDSAPARPDSARPVPPRPARPQPGQPAVPAQDTTDPVLRQRPPLNARFILRLAEVLEPGTAYAVEVRGVRNVNGATADARGGLSVPERRAPAPEQPDSAPPPDSTRQDASPGAPRP